MLRPAAEVYQELGVTPLTLRPKEGLALMNGTSVMTALACLAYARTDYLMRLATRITALVSVAMGATPSTLTSGCLPPSRTPACRASRPG